MTTRAVTPVISTTEVNTLTGQQIPYVSASSVLNELSMILVGKLTELAKDRFAREIMAGHGTDKDLDGFRVQVLNKLVDSAHKAMSDQRKDKDAKASLKFYRELIARGMTQAEAIKVAKL